MKKVLIAGPAEDAFHIMEYTQLSLAQSGADSFASLNPEDVSNCDGLLLPGGLPDVAPELYGETNQGSREIDLHLDHIQMGVLKAAVQNKKPILAICRGLQLLNVYFGGSLIQDIACAPLHRYLSDSDLLHKCINIPGTFTHTLYHGLSCVTNTKHHQAIRRLAPGFRVCQVWLSPEIAENEKARLLQEIQKRGTIIGTDQIIIEAIAHETLPIYGIQWHPENLVAVPLEGTADPHRIFDFFTAVHHILYHNFSNGRRRHR